jgi:uncharacterized protein YbjT (DUF2867 family)
MKILLCGARGFIGKRIAEALLRRGHTIVAGISGPPRGGEATAVRVDYARDTTPAAWLPRLEGIDAVVNAVGVLRDTAKRPIVETHQRAPIALFEACAEARVMRVVQVSALGIDGSPTAYAQTKLAAERRLQALVAEGRLDAAILRPSIVFGLGGASSELFLNLARLPLLLLPGPVLRARVQPIAVGELAEVIAALVDATTPVGEFAREPLEAVGPTPVGMADFIASLRSQSGRGSARVCALPGLVTQLSARIGDAIPVSPWCSETLAMLASDNVADPARFAARLGRPATAYGKLLAA